MNKNIDELFIEMLNQVNNNPALICTLDYEIMCDFIYVLFAKGHRDVAAKCVYAAEAKYGEKVYKDLKDNSDKLIRAIYDRKA